MMVEEIDPAATDNGRCPRRVLLVVVMLCAVVGLTLLRAQFVDEDEAMALHVGSKVADAISHGRLKEAVMRIGASYQPPGKCLLIVPFIWLMGATEAALRLPNILAWVAAAMVGALIGYRCGGFWPALVSGILLGASGLFNLQAMGLGHGFFTMVIMILIYMLVRYPSFSLRTPAERKRYVLGGIYCTLAFLWFTSAIVVALPYHLIFGYYAASGESRGSGQGNWYLALTAPFVAYYVTYYAMFLGVPAYMYRHGLVESPFGQLYQNLYRASSAHLNASSFLENLQGINGYFFPYLSWVLILIGSLYLFRRHRGVSLIISLYGLLFSFWISGNTIQHFLAYFSWVLPFGVCALAAWNGLPRPASILAGIAITLVVLSWSAWIHIVRYTDDTYPNRILSYTFSRIQWKNNVVRPYDEIARDLRASLSPQDRFIVLSDGAFPLFYFRDRRYLQMGSGGNPIERRVGAAGCLTPPANDDGRRVRAALSYAEQSFCKEFVEHTIRYNGSELKLTIFSRL